MLELLFYQFQILVLLNGPGTVWVYSCVSPHDAGKNYCLSAEKIVIDVLTSNNKKKSPKYNEQLHKLRYLCSDHFCLDFPYKCSTNILFTMF